MSPSKLIAAFYNGYIPGPFENEDEFHQRVEKSNFTLCEFPKAQELFSRHFVFFPHWVEIRAVKSSFFSFQGAAFCTEVCEATGKLQSCYIEINSLLMNSSLLKRLYPLEEILAHEWVHSARSHFNCPQFEEIIAYQTSKSVFRKYCGPLFDQSIFTRSLVYTGCSLLTIPFLSLVLPETFFLWSGGLLYFSFLFLFLFKAVRLFKNLSAFKKTIKIIHQHIVCRKKALSLIVGFTDEEIYVTSDTKSLEWIEKNQHNSLRNQMLYEVFTSFTSS